MYAGMETCTSDCFSRSIKAAAERTVATSLGEQEMFVV
jgi:hypothetical protein